MPAFSIIVPSYNRAHCLTETLSSLDSQTYRDFEVIIVDDGSIDSTQDLVSDFIKDKPNFKMIHNGLNLGESESINIGWKSAKGQYVAIVSSDDPQEISWLDLMISAISANRGFVIYYPNLRVIDESNRILASYSQKVWNNRNLYGHLLCIASAGSIINRSILAKEFLPRDNSIDFPSDLIQMLELGLIGSGFRVESCFGTWRDHKESLTSKTNPQFRATKFQKNVFLWIERNYVKNGLEKWLPLAFTYLLLQSWDMLRALKFGKNKVMIFLRLPYTKSLLLMPSVTGRLIIQISYLLTKKSWRFFTQNFTIIRGHFSQIDV